MGERIADRPDGPAAANLNARYENLGRVSEFVGSVAVAGAVELNLDVAEGSTPIESNRDTVLSNAASALKVLRAGNFSNDSVDAAKTVLAGDDATLEQLGAALAWAQGLQQEEREAI